MRRVAAAAALGLAVTAVVQSTLVPFLPAPLAALAPVTVGVLAFAHGRGALVGGAAGLWAGLLLDVLPPAAGPFGGWALVLCLAGLGMGHVVTTGRPGPFVSMVLVALGAGLTVLARGLVMWFAGAPMGLAALVVAGWVTITSLVLAPLALLAVSGSRRRSTARSRGAADRPPGLRGVGQRSPGHPKGLGRPMGRADPRPGTAQRPLSLVGVPPGPAPGQPRADHGATGPDAGAGR